MILICHSQVLLSFILTDFCVKSRANVPFLLPNSSNKISIYCTSDLVVILDTTRALMSGISWQTKVWVY